MWLSRDSFMPASCSVFGQALPRDPKARPSRLVSGAAGCKGPAVNPLQPDLVLYPARHRCRQPQNVLHLRPAPGDLVLYHSPPSPPLFHVPVAPPEVAGVLLAPALLSLLLAFLTAGRLPAGLLSVAHARVGHKISTAVRAPLRQGRPPSSFLSGRPFWRCSISSGKNCRLTHGRKELRAGTNSAVSGIFLPDANTLSPRLRITPDGGPMNRIPACSQASAKSGFSARKP